MGRKDRWDELLDMDADRSADEGADNESEIIRKITSQIDSYIKEPRYDRYEEPLHWWKTHAAKYQMLVDIAKKYLIIPASSATSKRVFKKARDHTQNREKLLPKNVEKLIFLKYNLRAVNYDTGGLNEPPHDITLPNNTTLPAAEMEENSVDLEMIELSNSDESSTKDCSDED